MMHQQITHLWREGQYIYQWGEWVGEIIALLAPGNYMVRDAWGHGCITDESRLEQQGVEVR